MRLAKILGISAALLVSLVAAVLVLNITYGIDDAYAQWGAVDMTIDYMRDHEGKWPPSWEALQPYFDESNGRVAGWSFEKYQERVYIDFQADADDLRKQAIASDSTPFDVIHARWSFGCVMGDGPNVDLYRYFRRQAGIFEAPEPDGGWQSAAHKQLADKWYQCGMHVEFDRDGELVAAWSTLSDPRPTRDADLDDLKDHPHLRSLNLVGTEEVTDAGLAVVKSLPNLKKLELGANVTDACLDHLSGHPKLAELDIFGTKITDAGFARLSELPQLQSVRCYERNISEDAVRTLQAARPNLKINCVKDNPTIVP